ncbi:hypothetical protein KDH_54990 [Dictyobacter sp. S3.2.2.5]|uniref:Transcription regulator MerR DNA binding domain-containing protein n=1 Tax=Dictyobacter halimunensis TaxID=3026934 RepID=A0ABQ6FYI8_9CHLR|nr:hypothetical protein KDH_54990 [Dictyobacter sp. S3.2.2.5]
MRRERKDPMGDLADVYLDTSEIASSIERQREMLREHMLQVKETYGAMLKKRSELLQWYRYHVDSIEPENR